MNELTKLERKTLKAIVLRFAEEPFAAEALERAFPGRLTGYEAELGIERLRERAIVETRRKSWGETVHALAPGLFADWQREFVPALADAVLGEGAVEPEYEPKSGLCKLIFRFASEAAHRGLTLTQKGAFHRKDAQRIASLIDADETALQGMAIEYLHQDKLDKRAAIVFDAAMRLGLVRAGTSAVEVNRARLDEWLATPLIDLERETRSLWWEVYTPADPWLQHAAAAFRNMPAGRWFSLTRIADALLRAGVPTGGRSEPEAREALSSYWLRPMAAFGLAELGASACGPAARLTADGDASEEGWYVQPDFEWIVPPAVPYAARWQLEACALFAGGDAVDRYRVTKESWERALRAGWNGERLIETMRRFAAYGMPDSVEAALRQWTDAYGALTIADVTLLRCRDAKDASYIRSAASLSGFIVEQLGELDFIVDGQEAKRLAEELGRQGFSVRTGGAAPAAAFPRDSEESGSERAASTAARPSVSGIVRSRPSGPLFPLDPSPEGAAPLRERISRVPSAWLRSLRSYHTSTVREVVETAIDVRTSVRLAVGGKEVDFVPKRLKPYGPDWIAEGYIDGEAASIAANACEAIQLVVPELE